MKKALSVLDCLWIRRFVYRELKQHYSEPAFNGGILLFAGFSQLAGNGTASKEMTLLWLFQLRWNLLSLSHCSFILFDILRAIYHGEAKQQGIIKKLGILKMVRRLLRCHVCLAFPTELIQELSLVMKLFQKNVIVFQH